MAVDMVILFMAKVVGAAQDYHRALCSYF